MIREAPYPLLAGLPRGVWLPALITSAGGRAPRLTDSVGWLAALQAGELPASTLDFGDPQASAPLRAAVGDLGLPALCRGTPALAEQVLRTLLWHLDRIAGHQPPLMRDQAIAQVSAEFRAAWPEDHAGLADDLALLQGLADPAALRWDDLRGLLNSRPWATARRAAEWLRQLPELVALIRRLGRTERAVAAAARTQPDPNPATPRPMRPMETRLPDAPGELTGVHFSARLDQMLPSEAVMLRHPVMARLWRARHAEARLLAWQTEAVLADWRPDPLSRPTAAGRDATPQALDRGPILLCLDTSGSMRGAPEQIAKAVVIAALRAAHEAGRGCRLICFGGPGEVTESDLGRGTAGLQALMDLMGQAFDGGTDLQSPLERAIDSVHDARWRSADLLLVSDGEFGCRPHTLDRLDAARASYGLRVQGVLVGDRETLGLLEVCDEIHWVRDWRRFAAAADDGPAAAGRAPGFSPVHSKSLTALYFPNALSPRAARHGGGHGAS